MSLLSPKQILVIGLSNIGDAILMSPVIAQLNARFPEAYVTLVVGERARPIFDGDPRVHRLVSMEECEGFVGRLRLVGLLWQLRPDALVDLRTTALPLLWRPWLAARFYWPPPKALLHMRARHLWRLQRQAGGSGPGATSPAPSTNQQCPVWIGPEDQQQVEHLITRWGLQASKRLVVLCPGARSHIKRWYPERFAAVADRLIESASVEVVVTGEPDEASVVEEVLKAMRHRAHNAVGCTTLRQLAVLMQRASLVLTNDSASLHLACAVNTPVLALFGPTDSRKYGPTGAVDRIVRRRLFCSPCEQALCRFTHECMRFIPVEEVYETSHQMLAGRSLK